MAASARNGWLKLGLEIGPLLLFFIVFGKFGIFWATGVFMAAVAVSMAVSKLKEGRIPVMLWVTGAIVLVMGSLTLYLRDESFVKMKPTLVNGIFAVLLAAGQLSGKNFLRMVMEDAMPPLTERGWRLIARNWMFFFAVMAIANEFVWRNVSTSAWVGIKTFGYFPATFAFALFQVFLMQRHLEAAGTESLAESLVPARESPPENDR